MKVCAILFAAVLCASSSASATQTNSLLAKWFAAQTNFQTWSADFVQTRKFRSLTQPLTATGKVWFAAPNRFYWQLGDPPKTIAVRTTNDLLVIYPRLKRVERFPVSGTKGGQWREALALLEAGFPRSEQDLYGQFRLVSQRVTNQICILELEPKSSGARRMMPKISIGFDANDLGLRSTELQFADGSTLRNDFTNAAVNPPIDRSRFEPQIEPGYKVVEPLDK